MLLGAAGRLLDIASSSTGVHVQLAVNAAVVQTIDYVNARDNTANTARIAPGAAVQYHSIDAGGLIEWLGEKCQGGRG